jgi:hypothetical protein
MAGSQTRVFKKNQNQVYFVTMGQTVQQEVAAVNVSSSKKKSCPLDK